MIDLNRKQFSIEFAGKPLTLEVSRLAEQATAAVLGRYEETVVLVSVVMSKTDRTTSFFPLTVDYEERFYAAGKIIGSRFVRREGRPSEEAVLSGRIIDRTIRPLFDHRIRRDVQVVVTVLSIDEKSDPDFIALLTASAALAISEIPWDGPVAGVKISKSEDGKFVVNPENGRADNDMCTAFVAGTEGKINMVELGGSDVQEEEAVKVFELAQREISKLVNWQRDIVLKIGHPKAVVPRIEISEKLRAQVTAFVADKLEEVIYTAGKQEREQRIAELTSALREKVGLDDPAAVAAAKQCLEEQIDALVHQNVLKNDRRPDGRRLDEIRDLYAEVGLFRRMHGSAIFVRGNTQALAITTLGPPNAEQIIETIEFSGKRRFLLHYNFPSYSVGEVKPLRGPGRREIGHGALAGKAIQNMLPSQEAFPYTIRVVSEILSSNGSSSMATVCAASLSLMDAGVPIKKSVAGIAMGLMTDSRGDYRILTDIQGPEDHYGDMDFKVAGTHDGITAIQLDVKMNGLAVPVMKEVLDRAKTARHQILDAMNSVLSTPRQEVSTFAPVIFTVNIPPSKIGEVIGPGGKIINNIIAETGVLSIDIEQTGKVFVTGLTKEQAQKALEVVKSIVKTFEVGEIVEGEVVKVLDFGAIVQISPHQDGMVHVSELRNGFVKNVEDVIKLGDMVRAKVIRIDSGGRIGLSIKALEAEQSIEKREE